MKIVLTEITRRKYQQIVVEYSLIVSMRGVRGVSVLNMLDGQTIKVRERVSEIIKKGGVSEKR